MSTIGASCSLSPGLNSHSSTGAHFLKLSYKDRFVDTSTIASSQSHSSLKTPSGWIYQLLVLSLRSPHPSFRAIEVVQVILEAVLLRREKTTKDKDGEPIVQLPPKSIAIRYLEHSPDERKLYDAIFKNVKKDYESLTATGMISKSITSMLARIMTYVSGLHLI